MAGSTGNTPRAIFISLPEPANGNTAVRPTAFRRFSPAKEFATPWTIGVPKVATTGPTGNTKCANTSAASFNRDLYSFCRDGLLRPSALGFSGFLGGKRDQDNRAASTPAPNAPSGTAPSQSPGLHRSTRRNSASAHPHASAISNPRAFGCRKDLQRRYARRDIFRPAAKYRSSWTT